MANVDKRFDLTMCETFISLIIPAYNAGEYLPKLLDSIVNQEYDSWEAIVVDDGSIDGISDIVSSYSDKDSRIKLIRQDNKSVCGVHNAGIKTSTGKWIWFVDADDKLLPGAMRRMADGVSAEDQRSNIIQAGDMP